MDEATKDIRDAMLTQCRQIANYWAALPGKTTEEKCHGVAFSILVMLDGGTDLPQLAVVPCVNDYCDTANDISGSLHELYYKS